MKANAPATALTITATVMAIGLLCLFSHSTATAQSLADAGLIKHDPSGSKTVSETPSPPPALEVRSISFEAKDALSGESIELDSIRISGGGTTITLDTVLVGAIQLVIDITTGIDAVPQDGGFHLSGNFANPFDDQTQFVVYSSVGGNVTVNLYDLNGNRIVNTQTSLDRGSSRFIIHGAGLPAGIYLLEVVDQYGRRMTSKVVKAGTGGSGSATIEYAGSTSGLDQAFGKITEQLNLQVTGYADRFVEQTLAVQVSADTTITFELRKDGGEPPVITLFSADIKRRALGFPVTLAVMLEDADGDLDSVMMDFNTDGTVDTVEVLTGYVTGDTLFYPVTYESTGSFTPSITVTDVMKNKASESLADPISIEPALVRAEVQVLLKEEIRNEGVEFDSLWVFTFPQGTATNMGLAVGSILVSDTGMGFLRKIIHLDTLGQVVTATTAQATMEELFDEVLIDKQFILGQDTVVQSSTQTGFFIPPKPFEFYYDYDGFKLYENGNEAVTLGGEVTIKPTLHFLLQVAQSTVRRAGFTLSADMNPRLDLSSTVDVTQAQLRMLLSKENLPQIKFKVGTVPVVLTPEMEVNLGMEGDILFAMQASVTIEENFSAGVTYENNAWQSTQTESHVMTFDPPHFGIGGNTTSYIEMSTALMIYGVNGPEAKAFLFHDLETQYPQTPLAMLYGGVCAGAGYEVSALGVAMVDYHDPYIVLLNEKIWEAQGTTVPMISDIDPDTLYAGKVMTIRGSGFGISQGASEVMFDHLTAVEYASWSDSEIQLRAPTIAEDGVLRVKTIDIDGRISGPHPHGFRDWYIIRGQATGSGVDVRGITITAGSYSTQTHADGSFVLDGITPRSYSVIPRKTGLHFEPELIAITVTNEDVDTLSFTASDISAYIPLVTTTPVSNVTNSTATCGGIITSDNGYEVFERGICWNATGSPTINDSIIYEGTGTGIYEIILSGLMANTQYYVKAFATNIAGTGYGNEISVITKPDSGVQSVTIGSQVWGLKNLAVTTYRNGDPIPQVTDSLQWYQLTSGAWCYYNNDPAMDAVYGKLYNWYAVNDPRGLAPAGWHVPSDEEWKTLEIYLGMSQSQADSGVGWRGTDEGNKLKEAGTSHWILSTGATNSSGFTAQPSGMRAAYDLGIYGHFEYLGNSGIWWTSTKSGFMDHVWMRILHTNVTRVQSNYTRPTDGISVRCVRD